ncbi:beta-ketoacyl-[acyl-carrier-protein] synthase family protein [Enterococcus faecalis]|nr:beta-ketoacyl-[acyl-carrier-protein] synthase family protein [Enterococcus faecalis]EGO5846364.1 beta-ketoacyl-[acyl-carrier-protein] synthase family protein [Enterococcus faecalis]
MNGGVNLKNKVVITGIGINCCLGKNKQMIIDELRKENYFKMTSLAEFDDLGKMYCGINHNVEKEEVKTIFSMDKSEKMALHAMKEALEHANLVLDNNLRLAVSLATSIMGSDYLENYVKETENLYWILNSKACLRRVIQTMGISAPMYTTSSACASGTDHISAISIYGFKSLDALSLSLAKPFSEERDGINLGEGCCVLILENQTYAQNRGATSYGEVVGYGLSNDAYHMTSPIPDGTGALSAMMQTTENKNISKDNSLYINAHGTGTKANDVMESKAIASFLSETELKCHISSTKSMTGHCLGAAGAVELGLSLIYQMSELKPITANSDERLLTELSSMNDQGFNYKYTLSNSFAFGGSNASILIKNLPTKQEQSNEY